MNPHLLDICCFVEIALVPVLRPNHVLILTPARHPFSVTKIYLEMTENDQNTPYPALAGAYRTNVDAVVAGNRFKMKNGKSRWFLDVLEA